jgi:uncharacterized protein with PQ loop repeat
MVQMLDRKKRMNKTAIALAVFVVLFIGLLVYVLQGVYNSSQTTKMNNAAMYGAQVMQLQMYANSANCNPVFVTAFDENGNQIQKPLMEVNPGCMQAYQQVAQQLAAAVQQQ